jgi:two-component system sensor histidine kinase/response regulator
MHRSRLFWQLAGSFVALVLLTAVVPALLGPSLGTGVVLAGLLTALLLVARLVRRLAVLGEAVEEMAQGKEHQALPAQGPDEIAAIARAVEQLALRQRQEKLQQLADQDQLKLAREAADNAQRARSDFLAILSHEIRTPLNGIMGMTQLALRTSLGAEQREYIEIVQASADFLLAVINDLHDFSRIEAGTLQLASIRFALRATLAETIKLLGFRASQKDLELLFQVAADVPDALRGDPDRLRQLLVNLIGNAVNFTERGEVLVSVQREAQSAERETSPGAPRSALCALRFSVTDTGIGIPLEKQAKLFEPPTILEKSPGRFTDRPGLGLAIARFLVERMGGEISVQSTPGKGSTFSFTARFQREEATPGPFPPGLLRGAAAILVDDNATCRRIVQQLLTSWHMTCLAVGEASQALAALEETQSRPETFAVALIDAHMPATDGFALVQQIRQRAAPPGLPIVMLTSGHQPEDVARCRELGVAGHVMKPLIPAELLQAVTRALGGSMPAAEQPSPPTAAPPSPARSLRIVLAEANPINRQQALVLLEKLGHQVTVAASGSEVLALIEQRSLDVLLLDVQQPELDGFETTAAIRAREKASGGRLPIVALVAYGAQGQRERCRAAGMDSCVTKPLQIQELVAALESVLLPPVSDYQL